MSPVPTPEYAPPRAIRRASPVLARSLFLLHHLSEFLTACADAGLAVIVLKGAALTETVYPDLGVRDFRDIDVLVRPADAGRARRILERLGYGVDAAHWESLRDGTDCQADFAKATPAGPVVLELHTGLINNDLLWGQVRVDERGLWERTEAVTLAGARARVLGPEDQILHLCLHLAGHYLAAPRSLQDIHQVCRKREIDWEMLVATARRAGMSTLTYAALWLAVRLTGAAIPAETLTVLAPAAWRRRRLERVAEARGRDVTGTATDAIRLPLLLLLLDGRLAVPRALGRVLFPSRRWLHDHHAAPRTRSGLGALYARHLRFLTRALFGRRSA